MVTHHSIFTSSKSATASLKTVDSSTVSKRKADDISPSIDDENHLDHVLGSAAEVERVWSWARYILTSQRASMVPVLFEAIMFLKFNRDIWDEKIVQIAYDLYNKDAAADYVKSKVKEASVEEGDLEDNRLEEQEFQNNFFNC